MGRVAQLLELSIHDSADPFIPRCVYFIEIHYLWNANIRMCTYIHMFGRRCDARGGLLLAGIEHDNLSKNI